MSAPQGYLLDTNIVLHATRQNSPVAAALETQFQLRQSPFRPAICEITVGEMWAFAQSWGPARKESLKRTIADLLVIPIGDTRIYHFWAELYSFAKAGGLAIQHDHNDVWIAATARAAGLRLLTMDKAGFLPLRGTHWVDVTVVDARTGIIIP